MDEFVSLDIFSTEAEAEIVCALLRTAGIDCAVRVTNFGSGAADGLPVGGPQEVIVRARDLEAAREVVQGQSP